MLMKWRSKLHSLIGLLAMLIMVALPMLTVSATAYASAGCPDGCGGGSSLDTSIGTFVYAEAYVGQLVSDVKANTKDDTSFFSTDTAVYIKNPGSVPGGQPIEATYNAARSEATGTDTYSYGVTYDCTTSGIASTDLTPSTPHWTISYIVDQQLSSNVDSDTQIQGNAYYNHISSLPSGKSKGSASSGPVSTPTLGAPSSCFPYTTGPILLDNYNQLNPTDQAEYPANAATIAALGSGGGGGGGGGGSTPEDQCAGDSSAGVLGWILCPLIDVATGTINDVVKNFLVPELQVQPFNQGSAAYQVWDNIRTLANVMFVIAFMVIIFANVLQFNIETYTIKKMLPRLVAAVILVQFSFITSAAIVDASNILGNGISALLTLPVHDSLTSAATGNPVGNGSTGPGVLSYMGGILEAGIAIGTATLLVGVPTLVIAAVGALISAIGVLFTIIVRRLIITMLVIAAPLAFALWILPNTEKYFKMWLSNFIKVALMYPIIMFILSAAALGAVAEQNTAAGSTGSHSAIQALLGSLFPIIAFFMIPMTFKWAGSAMGFASNYVSGITSGARSGATNSMKNSRWKESLDKNRAERKEAKLHSAVEAGGFKGWAAGARTRGDFLGKNRKLGFGRLKPSDELERRQMEQELEMAQHATETNMPLRRQAHARQLEQQALSAVTAMHEKESSSELLKSLQDAARRKDTTAAKAIAGLASKQGVLDQPEYLTTMLSAFDMSTDTGKDEAQKAINYARDQNYGAIQKDNYLLSRMDVTKGDVLAADGSLTLGVGREEVISGMAPERLANQTGKGHLVTKNVQVQQADGTLKGSMDIIPASTLETVRTSQMLKTKIVAGGDLDQIISRGTARTAPRPAAGGGSVDDLGVAGATPTPPPTTPPPSGPRPGDTVSPGGVVLPPGVRDRDE